jgi:hypothetical protein
LHPSIDGKQEFRHEELVYCNLISKALLVSSNLKMEMVQAFGEDALLAKENPRCLLEQLDLDSKAVDIRRYVD